MSPQTMSGFMSIQGGPPSASDIASQMMSQLDTITFDDLCQDARAKGLGTARAKPPQPPRVVV